MSAKVTTEWKDFRKFGREKAMRNEYHLPWVVVVGLLQGSEDLNHCRIAGGRLERLRVAQGELLD